MTILMRTYKHRVSIGLATALTLCLMTVCLPSTWGAEAENLEQRVKAAYLYNFTKFIQWPQGALADPEAPFTLAIVGAASYGDALNPLMQKQIQGRPLRIIQLNRDTPLPSAIDMLFITHLNQSEIRSVLAKVEAKPVLTIGNADTFIQNGGLIRFYRTGNKIRFEINARAAREKGFRISSQLLKLARIVEGGAP
jgi:hypothetical protein